MKTMFTAFAAIAIISVGSWFALGYAGFSAAEQGSGSSVRLD